MPAGKSGMGVAMSSRCIDQQRSDCCRNGSDQGTTELAASLGAPSAVQTAPVHQAEAGGSLLAI